MPGKLESVIKAIEKENKKEIISAISNMTDAEVHELRKIAPALRVAVASPRFHQKNGKIRVLTARKAHVIIARNDDDEQEKVSQEEIKELNELYSERVQTPKEEFIKYPGHDAFYDLIMKTKKEKGWKFKDE